MSLNVKDILSAAAADGEGAPVLVEDFGDIVIDIATASSANGTIKIYGSISQDPPDFAAAQSVSNMYDTLQVVDLESRYKITFTCDTAPIFNTVSGQEPGINLNGTVTNVNIGINLQPSLKGIVGPMGEQGLQGESGKSTIPGNKGVTGYYGLRGDITK